MPHVAEAARARKRHKRRRKRRYKITEDSPFWRSKDRPTSPGTRGDLMRG